MGQVTPLESNLEPFPGYRLRKRIGGGSFGEIWETEAPNNRVIALKFLPCNHERSTTQEIRSLQKVRQLRHPNLIQVEQVWCHMGYIIVAMEMADGSLADLLGIYQEEFNTPIVPEHACLLLSQAADGLDFLNTRQHWLDGRRVAVQHCDVKPSNLLLFGDRVKLADFGLSSWMSTQLQEHRRQGTLDFCAPEVFQGRLSDSTDQYALAVTYCLLRGGRLPFPETPPGFRVGYVRPPPDLSMLSEAEQPVIARALSPVPQNRWPTCSELMARLTRAVS